MLLFYPIAATDYPKNSEQGVWIALQENAAEFRIIYELRNNAHLIFIKRAYIFCDTLLRAFFTREVLDCVTSMIDIL